LPIVLGMASKKQSIDLEQLRRVALTGVVSDDVLADRLVLKGGNAIRFGHNLRSRASLDLDFSISDDFASLDELAEPLMKGLRERFAAIGFVTFDEKVVPRPKRKPDDPTWGGYLATLKLLPAKRFEELREDLDRMRREAVAVNGSAGSALTIEVSKFEFLETETIDIDGYQVKTYTKRLIVAEKLRAICQQMDGVPPEGKSVARARDFFDIHALCSSGAVLGEDFGDLLAHVFAKKNVPLSALGRITDERAKHEPDWPSVRDSAQLAASNEFDEYFKFVVDLCERYMPGGT
jgi:hypothetical protein